MANYLILLILLAVSELCLAGQTCHLYIDNQSAHDFTRNESETRSYQMYYWDFPKKILKNTMGHATVEPSENFFIDSKLDYGYTEYYLEDTKIKGMLAFGIDFRYTTNMPSHYTPKYRRYAFMVKYNNFYNLGSGSQEIGWKRTPLNLGYCEYKVKIKGEFGGKGFSIFTMDNSKDTRMLPVKNSTIDKFNYNQNDF